MGAIQSSINSAIGSAGQAAGISKMIKGQEEQLANQAAMKEIQILENEKELSSLSTDLTNQTNTLAKKYGFGEDGMPVEMKDDETEEAYRDRVISEGQEKAAIAAKDETVKAQIGVSAANMWGTTEQQSKAQSRLDKAVSALNDLNDEVEARRALKFDLDTAWKKREILTGGNK